MRISQKMVQPIQTAFVMVNCEYGHESGVIEQLRSIEGVKETIRTNGPYDILCSIEVSTIESLKEVIEQKIRKTPHTISTTTLIKSH